MDSRPGDPGAAGGTAHYFADSPGAPSRPVEVALDLVDVSLRLETDTGVFSHGKVDPGTKLLLIELEGRLPGSGALVDVGCGYGPLALATARRQPSQEVWAVDRNRRALELCRANAERNDVRNVRVSTPEAVPGDLRFAAIVSNPPIRIGKAALHALLGHWLDRLEPDGTAWLVVHKHLGSDSLARWLAEQEWQVARVVSRQGYRVLRVQR